MKHGFLKPVLSASLMVASLASPVLGEEPKLDKALGQARSDLSAAVEELNETRARIAGKRKPLAERLQRLQATVAALRGEAESIRKTRLQTEFEYENLKRETRSREEAVRFVNAVLSEYRRSIETRAGIAESAWMREKLRQVDRKLAEEGDDLLPSIAGDLVKLAGEWNMARFGGFAFDGRVVDPNGVERSGRLVVMGPFAYFAGDEVAGVVVSRPGSLYPGVADASTGTDGGDIRALVNGEEARVPLDPSLGDALKVRESRGTFVGHLKKGGVVIIPLLLVGLAALAITMERFAAIRNYRAESVETEHVAALLREGKVGEAESLAADAGFPLSALLDEGIKHRGVRKENAEEILREHAMSLSPSLEKHLGTLAVLGGVAPLLGLLGTVTGMIHTFRLVTIFGSGDAKLLSGGISEALVTTEIGLIIAVPVLLIHAFLSRRVRTIAGEMDRSVAVFVNRLYGDVDSANE